MKIHIQNIYIEAILGSIGVHDYSQKSIVDEKNCL
jgi:hypothetical protein